MMLILKPTTDLYGLSHPLGGILSYSIFYEHDKSPKPWTHYLTHPLQSLFGAFGMRTPHETDPKTGIQVLNLDQLAQHNIIEHDVSLSRLDFAQGDNLSPQKHLISQILSASRDGKYLTIDDIVELRKQRFATQKQNNPKLEFGSQQEVLASAEAALLLKVFGDGEKVEVGYVRAFFVDERMPLEEGWKARRWWGVGLVEAFSLAGKIKKRVGAEH